MRKIASAMVRRISRARERYASWRRRGPVCERVSDWARDRGDAVEVVIPPEHVDRRPPRTVDGEVPREYTSRMYSNFVEKYLVAIDGASLVGPSALVVLPDGLPAVESVFGVKAYDPARGQLWPLGRRRVAKPGRYFSLVTHFAVTGGYYHWMHDAMQRLHCVLDRLPPDTRFVVPSGMRPFQRDSLAALGIGPDRTVEYTGTEEWTLGTLYFTNQTPSSGLHRGSADRWLRDELLRSFGLRLGEPHRRVYLSRANQRRTIVNEDQVVELLGGHGFEVVYPEALSLREQVALMSEAEALVAPHGSALTNIQWAPEGLMVVDLVEDSNLGWAHIFWAMAEELGHEYWYLRAETVPHPGRQNDGRVAIDQLAEVLDQGLSR